MANDDNGCGCRCEQYKYNMWCCSVCSQFAYCPFKGNEYIDDVDMYDIIHRLLNEQNYIPISQ